jgi:hypothetical protein
MKKSSKYLFATILGLVALVLCFVTADAQSTFMLATFTPCLGVLADNISTDCDNPRVQGYEQIGLIFNRSDIDWTAVTYDSSNPRIVKTLAMASGATPFVIYNSRSNPLPFNGTTTVFNSDNNRYDKTVQFYFEGIGGEAAMDVVEPLKGGQYVILLQRKDHRGDGSFQLIGMQTGLVATAQEQNEDTGYWLMTMGCSEPSAEIAFLDTDYATTKAAFDTLLALVP